MKKRVIVVDPQFEWNHAFEDIKTFLLKNIGVPNIQIEHVGSTSVVGLSAKPIIDIVIVFNSMDEFEIIKRCLENINYIHVGNQGIQDREAFKLTKPNDLYNHHLYVALRGSLGLKNPLTFRDHLRNHPNDVQRYGNLKKELAKQYPFDIDSYIEGKTDFIISVLKQYDFSQEELMEIIKINKKKSINSISNMMTH